MPRETWPVDGAHGVLMDSGYAVRLFLAAVLGWWAYVLALPGDTFGASPGYAWFAARGTEAGWAAFTGLSSLVCGSALIYRATWWRAASAILASVAYGVIAYGAWASNPRSTGTGTYIACSALCYALAARNLLAPPGTPDHRPR